MKKKFFNTVHRFEKQVGIANQAFRYTRGFPLSNDPILHAIAEMFGDVGGLILIYDLWSEELNIIRLIRF